MQNIHPTQKDLSYQNLRNKTTVKKDKTLFHRLALFDQIDNKQNVHNQENIINQQIKNVNRKFEERKQGQMICANHPQKQAEFIVKIDGQVLNYCRKCATHVASQGFDVVPKAAQVNPRVRPLIPSPCRNRSNTQPVQKRLQLTQFTRKLHHLSNEYNKKYERLQAICQSFSIQKQTLTTYYSQLIQYIQDMRNKHLQAIEQESIKSIQTCEIEAGQVKETQEEIQTMIRDVETNIDNIVLNIDQQSYLQCLSFYRQKQGLYSHRLEELGHAKEWPTTTQAEIQNKLQNFKQFIDQLHGLQDEEDQDSVEVQSRYQY